MQILEGVSLSEKTTIKTGGRARYFISCVSGDDVREALRFASARGLPILIMGGGSNLLIADHEFAGAVISVEIPGIKFEQAGRVTVGSGVIWDHFVAEAVSKGFAGIEALSGIPGKVGATPIQNVGAYGQEVCETIVSLMAINRETREIKYFTAAECQFGYRDSIFKGGEKNRWIILEVTFQLRDYTCGAPAYVELKAALESIPQWQNMDARRRLSVTRDKVLEIRRQKGMVLDPSDSDTFSLGSYFMNPVITTAEKDKLIDYAKAAFPQHNVPIYPMPAGQWKISAAWLIEKSGIKRGFSLGGAKVSTKHVLAITNPGGATTQDILNLEHHIRKSVDDAFGITLCREPDLVMSALTI